MCACVLACMRVCVCEMHYLQMVLMSKFVVVVCFCCCCCVCVFVCVCVLFLNSKCYVLK